MGEKAALSGDLVDGIRQGGHRRFFKPGPHRVLHSRGLGCRLKSKPENGAADGGGGKKYKFPCHVMHYAIPGDPTQCN